jgi:hypothetical protein
MPANAFENRVGNNPQKFKDIIVEEDEESK